MTKSCLRNTSFLMQLGHRANHYRHLDSQKDTERRLQSCTEERREYETQSGSALQTEGGGEVRQ